MIIKLIIIFTMYMEHALCSLWRNMTLVMTIKVAGLIFTIDKESMLYKT